MLAGLHLIVTWRSLASLWVMVSLWEQVRLLVGTAGARGAGRVLVWSCLGIRFARGKRFLSSSREALTFLISSSLAHGDFVRLSG